MTSPLVTEAEVQAAARAMALPALQDWEHELTDAERDIFLIDARAALEAAAKVREGQIAERAHRLAQRYAEATRDLPDVPDQPMPKRAKAAEPSVPLSALAEYRAWLSFRGDLSEALTALDSAFPQLKEAEPAASDGKDGK